MCVCVCVCVCVWMSLFCLSFPFRFIGLVGRVFANGPVDRGSIPVRVIPKTLKMVLDTYLLSIIRYLSRVQCSNPGKGVMPSPTSWCSSYWKGSLPVALDYGRQLTLYHVYANANTVLVSGDSTKYPLYFQASECDYILKSRQSLVLGEKWDQPQALIKATGKSIAEFVLNWPPS